MKRMCFRKSHRGPFRSRPTCPQVVGELISTDVCGPMEVTSLGGNRYFVLFKDYYSKYRRVFFIKNKSEVAHCMRIFLGEAKQDGKVIKEMLFDNGSEFLSKETTKVIQENGIRIRTTSPYCPEQNGSVERENRTIVESARSMLQSNDLPKFLWAEACNTAVYLLNLTGPSPVEGKSPLELWSCKNVPGLKHLRVFGTKCFVHEPKQKQKEVGC